MAQASSGAPPATFVRALLRTGSPLTDQEPEETPHATGGPSAAGDIGDAMLARACRWSVLAALVYRIAAFPKVLIGFLSSNHAVGLVPVLGATVLAVALNVAAVLGMLRGPGLQARLAGRLVAADLVLGVLINLLVAATAPAAVQPFAVDVTWTWLVGTIALWTFCYGVPAALWLLLGAVPLRLALTWAGGVPLNDPTAVNRSVGCLIALAVAIATAAGILILVGVGTRYALTMGIRRGQQAERERTLRMLHDGVLQTLEAMAMVVPGDDELAAERLSEVRAAARVQAADLRRELTEPELADSQPSLAVELSQVAAEMARAGLRTQLVASDIDEAATLSQARRTAMCDAVREALRNTAKHAGTKQVVVRVEERDGGIAVIARDHGQGFSTEDHPPGFGISRSIMGRLAEVGGHAAVDSTPGRGTRVTMWVPR
jgi:signal transduction histidine kinase